MECKQYCYECKDEKGMPRKWLWLCEECAEDNEEKHRKETGHTCETIFTRPDSSDSRKVFGMITEASRLMGRRRW